MTAVLSPPPTLDLGDVVTDCPCACHGGNGAFGTPCDVPGGCHTHHREGTGSQHGTAVRRCVAGGKAHEPVPGALLCGPHLNLLGNWLRDIERQAEQQVFNPDRPGEWSALPSMQSTYDGTHGGTLASQQSPARLDAIVLSDPRRGDPRRSTYNATAYRVAGDALAYEGTPSVIETLHRWARSVRTNPARMLTDPTVALALDWSWEPDPAAGPVCELACGHDSCGRWLPVTDTVRAEPTVASERELLTRQLDWIAGQPWVRLFYGQMRSLRSSLRRSNHTEAPRPHGRCPSQVTGTDGKQVECKGALWPVKPKHTSGTEWTTSSEPTVIACESCGERWEGPSDLARLSLILEKARKAKKARGGTP